MGKILFADSFWGQLFVGHLVHSRPMNDEKSELLKPRTCSLKGAATQVARLEKFGLNFSIRRL